MSPTEPGTRLSALYSLAAKLRTRVNSATVPTGRPVSAACLSRYCTIVVITVPCDHVSGLTLIGPPLYGSNCSASTPDSSARARRARR